MPIESNNLTGVTGLQIAFSVPTDGSVGAVLAKDNSVWVVTGMRLTLGDEPQLRLSPILTSDGATQIVEATASAKGTERIAPDQPEGTAIWVPISQISALKRPPNN